MLSTLLDICPLSRKGCTIAYHKFCASSSVSISSGHLQNQQTGGNEVQALLQYWVSMRSLANDCIMGKNPPLWRNLCRRLSIHMMISCTLANFLFSVMAPREVDLIIPRIIFSCIHPMGEGQSSFGQTEVGQDAGYNESMYVDILAKLVSLQESLLIFAFLRV